MILKGLTARQVIERRKQNGEHIIPAHDEQSWFITLFDQFKDPLIYILVAVGGASLLLHEYIDAWLIGIVIIIDVLMGFFQEYSAQQTLIALKKIVKPTVIVVRDGQRQEVELRTLVPGDLVIIGPGDKIPADGLLVYGAELLVHEALLTGEEEAIEKTTDEKNNRLFMGTVALSGTGIMEVTHTGTQTHMGRIGQSIAQASEEKTPIQQKLDVFAKHLSILVLIICSCVFIVGILNGKPYLDMLEMAIILSMAAIPHGLSIAITMILSLGSRRILKKNGLVKRLSSIETLGVTSVICIDKTGTLTEGIMRVVKTDFSDKPQALHALTINNTQKNSLEVAMWEYVAREQAFDQFTLLEHTQKIHEEPFDDEKKYSLTISEHKNKRMCCLVGAPEIALTFCRVTPQEHDHITTTMNAWADEGLRIFGIIFKDQGNLTEKKDFTWAGLLGVADPIRKEAPEALLMAQKAGMRVKIVTGDYRKTVERLAKNLGLTVNHDQVMDGQELEEISDIELKEHIDTIVIFARVTPHQKQKIVRVLQEKGEIVAMTGDGVNDAPALKKADIGIAVASACDVAKEAADLILLDSNFKIIVEACAEGRHIFYNIKKTVGYVLSNSFEEIIVVFGAVLLRLPTPLTVIQILWIKLICDGPPDLALAFEPAEAAFMHEKPQDIQRQDILDTMTKYLIAAVSLVAGLLSLTLFWFFAIKNGNLLLGRTMVFASLGCVSLIYIFSYKSLQHPLWSTTHFFQNKFMIAGVIYGFILLAVALYIPFFNRIVQTVPLSWFHWILVLGVGCAVTLTVELIKKVYHKW